MVTVGCGTARPSAVLDRADGAHEELAPIRGSAVHLYMISPNPASEAVQIAWTGGDSEPIQVAIFDAQGRLVWKQTTAAAEHALRLNVSNWTAGLYLVLLRGKDGAVAKRLVVD